MDTTSTSSILTPIVLKTFAGIGVLDLLRNYSADFRVGEAPSSMIKTLTGVGFGLASVFSDWSFGGCMVYDLVASSVGQRAIRRESGNLLGIHAVGSASIVAARNLMR